MPTNNLCVYTFYIVICYRLKFISNIRRGILWILYVISCITRASVLYLSSKCKPKRYKRIICFSKKIFYIKVRKKINFLLTREAASRMKSRISLKKIRITRYHVRLNHGTNKAFRCYSLLLLVRQAEINGEKECWGGGKRKRNGTIRKGKNGKGRVIVRVRKKEKERCNEKWRCLNVWHCRRGGMR